MTLPKIYPLHTQLGAVTKENENKITTNKSNNQEKGRNIARTNQPPQ